MRRTRRIRRGSAISRNDLCSMNHPFGDGTNAQKKKKKVVTDKEDVL